MKKITNDNFMSFYEPKRDLYNHWGELDRALTKFANYSNQRVFEYIFNAEGEKGGEGERLWVHYILDCHRDFNKFKTYLNNNQNQYNFLLINVIENGDLLYSL